MFVLPWIMPRTLKQILDHLEGPGFDARINICEGIRTARAACAANPDWQGLVSILKLHELAGGDALDIVSARFWSWATMEVPPPMRTYGHPKDVACFAVIYAVSKAAPGRVDRMLQDVSFGPEWFWLAMITDVIVCSRESEQTPGSTAPRSACPG